MIIPFSLALEAVQSCPDGQPNPFPYKRFEIIALVLQSISTEAVICEDGKEIKSTPNYFVLCVREDGILFVMDFMILLNATHEGFHYRVRR